MGSFPPELKDQRDLFGWAKRLAGYLRSTVLRGGRGISVQQTDSGTTVSLSNHSADHAPGGKDEVKFPTLEITEPVAVDPKRIIFNPAWSDFLAGRVFCVNDAGTFTAWRTLLDLLDGLPGFAAGKALIVNVTADGLEFGEAGSELPSNVVMESATTAFQPGKLVIASGTAHELLGTLIGINLAGAAYQGYGDSDLSTDARVAQIADARFNAVGGIKGSGGIGQVAVFYDDHSIEGANFGALFTANTASISGLGSGEWMFCYNGTTDVWSYQPITTGLPAGTVGQVLYHNGTSWVVLDKPTSNKVLMNTAAGALSWAESLPSGSAGQVLYHNGTSWVVLAKPDSTLFLRNTSAGGVAWADPLPSGTVGQILYNTGAGWALLNKPASDMFLKNTASGAVAWAATPAATVQSSGGTGASLVTADGKIKTIYGY